MNKQTFSSFQSELSKIAASGVIGDVLTGSFLMRTLAQGTHQAKGMVSALKAGAKLKDALHADPLPLGKEWKYMKTRSGIKIAPNKIKSPGKQKTAWELAMSNQADKASMVGIPVGLAFSQAGKDKNKKRS